MIILSVSFPFYKIRQFKLFKLPTQWIGALECKSSKALLQYNLLSLLVSQSLPSLLPFPTSVVFRWMYFQNIQRWIISTRDYWLESSDQTSTCSQHSCTFHFSLSFSMGSCYIGQGSTQYLVSSHSPISVSWVLEHNTHHITPALLGLLSRLPFFWSFPFPNLSTSVSTWLWTVGGSKV